MNLVAVFQGSPRGHLFSLICAARCLLMAYFNGYGRVNAVTYSSTVVVTTRLLTLLLPRAWPVGSRSLHPSHTTKILNELSLVGFDAVVAAPSHE